MFTSIVIHISPQEISSITVNTGGLIREWYLSLIRQIDPQSADELEAGDSLRPYTLSNLVGLGPIQRGQRSLSPERIGWLRITALTAEHSHLLIDKLIPLIRTTGLIAFGGVSFCVKDISTQNTTHRWAGQSTPQNLITAGSLTLNMSRRLEVNFFSPTCFRSDGSSIPFPIPKLVFGNLLRRWNTFSPIKLHPETRSFIEAKMVVSRYKLRTQTVHVGEGEVVGMIPGCKGSCVYYIQSSDKYWIGTVRTLASFAFYAGIGTRTTLGMGQAVFSQWIANGPNTAVSNFSL